MARRNFGRTTRLRAPVVGTLLALGCVGEPTARPAARPDAESAAESATEDTLLLFALDAIELGRLDEAESILQRVDAADVNLYMVQFGREPGHFIAREYLAVVERRRAGDRSDRMFRTPRFRFHVRGVDLDAADEQRIGTTCERTLSRVAAWADSEPWRAPHHRTVFVEIAPAFPTPSPARSLIFRWDRQERSPRLELAERILAPRILDRVLAHELTHVVLPHTNRPLAEGIARLAENELEPDVDLGLRRPPHVGERWPLDEVLLFNFRGQGRIVREAYDALRAGGFGGAAARTIFAAYDHGDRLIGMIDAHFGRDRLMAFYRATNRDPATFDVLAATGELLAPVDELRELWRSQ